MNDETSPRWHSTAKLLAALAFLSALGSAEVLAQSEEDLTRARATFAEGVQLLNRSRWADAAERFREVMQVRPTAQVKYNLGLALSHLDDDDVREARVLLREASEDETLPADVRQSARRRLEEIGPGEEEATIGEAAPQTSQESTRGSLSQPFVGQRPITLEAHIGFSFWGLGLATGARVGIPLVPNLVGSFSNALYLTIGLEFYYVRRVGRAYGPGIGVPIAALWEVYFDDTWSAFIELGAQFFVHPSTFANERFDVYEPGYWVVARVGGSWRPHPNVALTVRVGTPSASVGVTLLF